MEGRTRSTIEFMARDRSADGFFISFRVARTAPQRECPGLDIAQST
jgi:hypothetical protein